jgi:hypothetical protein
MLLCSIQSPMFDGQGAPDAFQPALTVEHDPDGTPTLSLGIGIGIIDTKADTILERCAWDIDWRDGTLLFRATQRATCLGKEARTTSSSWVIRATGLSRSYRSIR